MSSSPLPPSIALDPRADRVALAGDAVVGDPFVVGRRRVHADGLHLRGVGERVNALAAVEAVGAGAAEEACRPEGAEDVVARAVEKQRRGVRAVDVVVAGTVVDGDGGGQRREVERVVAVTEAKLDVSGLGARQARGTVIRAVGDRRPVSELQAVHDERPAGVEGG